MTVEEMLASQSEFAHFNEKHDKLGRFASKSGGSSQSKGMSQQQFNKLGTAVAIGAAAAIQTYNGQKAISDLANALANEKVVSPSMLDVGMKGVAAALVTYGAWSVYDFAKSRTKPTSQKKPDAK